jgi:hypothetical protein
MTESEESELFDVADAFLDLANELNKNWPAKRISEAFSYAAARYSAFDYLVSDDPKDDERDAVEGYCAQYRKALLENLDRLRTELNDGKET